MTEKQPEINYEQKFKDLTIQFESLQNKNSEYEKVIKERDDKITELKTYIADNLISKPNDNNPDKMGNTKSFDDLYKETLSQMAKNNNN